MADEGGKSSRHSVASTSTAAPPPPPFYPHEGAVTAAFLTPSCYSTPAMGSHLSGSSDRLQNNNSSRIVAGGPGVPLSFGGSSSQGAGVPSSLPTLAFPAGTMVTSHAAAPTPNHVSQMPPLPLPILVKSEFPVPTQQACGGCGAPCGPSEITPRQPPAATLLPPVPFLTPYVPPVPHFTNFPSHYSSLLSGKESSAALTRGTLTPASSAYLTPAIPPQSISSGPAHIPLPMLSPNQPKMDAINSNIPLQTRSCNQIQHGSPPISLAALPSAKVPTAAVPDPPISIEPAQLPDSFPREPVSAGERGEGWPYAPQGWPSADDKWGWRVGKRSGPNGQWIDRYITIPKSLAKGRKAVEFASRKGLTEFLKHNFPHVNADSIFKAFEWRVPAVKVTEAPKVPPTKRDKPLSHAGDSSCHRPKKRCRACNPHCYLETGKGSVSGAAEMLDCHICCSEPGYCCVCKCILCCKAFTPDTDDIDVIRCLNRPTGAGICNHAAHLECAVKAQLAGVIKKNGLDVEYMCRRCDRKTDLRESVSRLIESMGRTTLQSKVERNLQLALRIMQDSQDGENLPSRALSVLIEKVLKKVQMGADIQDTYKELTQQALAYEPDEFAWDDMGLNIVVQDKGSMIVKCRLNYKTGRSQATGLKNLFEALLHHSEASLDKQLASCSPPASQPLPATPNLAASLEQALNTCAVGPPQGDANEDPNITHMQVNGTAKHNLSDGVVLMNPTILQPEHIANGCLTSAPLETLVEIEPPIPVSMSGLISQSVSRSSAFSIEEHIKQCEAIANRVKGAGQLITQGRGSAVSQFPVTEVNLSSVVKGAGQIPVTGVEFSPVVKPNSWISGTSSVQLVENHQQATKPSLGVVLSSSVSKRTVLLPDHMSDTQSNPNLQRPLDVSPNREALELSEIQREVSCTIPSPWAALKSSCEGLEAEFDTQVDVALEKLKMAQAAEYARAEGSLLNQKNIVLEEYRYLGCVGQDFAKQEKAQQSAPNTRDDLLEPRVQIGQAMNQLLDQFAKAKEAHKVFQSMLGISSGFGQVSKDFLEQYFVMHTWDSSGNP